VTLSADEAPPAHELVAPLVRALMQTSREAAARVVTRRADDPEAVHDFRVALRRLRSVLRPLRKLYGPKRMRAIGDELRELANATGLLREEEALRETLVGLPLPKPTKSVLDAWMTRRARQERALRSGVARHVERAMAEPTGGACPGAPGESGALVDALRRIDKVLVRGGRTPIATEALIESALTRARADVFAHAAAPVSDGVAMHLLRIRFKRLRYTAELFAKMTASDAPDDSTELARVAKRAARLQKRLGELHDLDEAAHRVRRAWGLPEPTRTRVITALARERRQVERRARTELQDELSSWPRTL
jgi:CHAD domain-containing protein